MKLKQIVNISAERLNYSEFKEYVTDYFKNPREYRTGISLSKAIRFSHHINHYNIASC